MKHILIFSLSLMLLLAFVITGCGDDDNPADSIVPGFPAGLIGTWEQQSVTFNGATQDLGTFFDWETGAVKGTLEFFTNSTHRYEELDAQDSILYYRVGPAVVSGQNLTLIATSELGQTISPDTTFVGTWVLGVDVLTATMVQGSDTAILVLTK